MEDKKTLDKLDKVTQQLKAISDKLSVAFGVDTKGGTSKVKKTLTPEEVSKVRVTATETATVYKNILGLGNSGMQFWPLKKMLSKVKTFKDGNDWLFFSSAEYDLNCLFISNCQTNYRQHLNNLIGRKSLHLDSLVYLIECKIKHYCKLKWKKLILQTEVPLLEVKVTIPNAFVSVPVIAGAI